MTGTGLVASMTADGGAAGLSFDFQQLRQALEISGLRHELARVCGDADHLKSVIEAEVWSVRERLQDVQPAVLWQPDTLAPLLGDALAALITIRNAARDFDTVPQRTAGPKPDAVPAQPAEDPPNGSADQPCAAPEPKTPQDPPQAVPTGTDEGDGAAKHGIC